MAFFFYQKMILSLFHSFHIIMCPNRKHKVVFQDNFELELNREDISFLPNNIQEKLFPLNGNQQEYHLQSFIHKETFEKFILFYKDQLSINELSETDIEELKILNDELKNDKLNQFLEQILNQEKQIIGSFDDYLLHDRKSLIEIPYGSLYRIFFNPNINFHEHNLAYEFIKDTVKRANNTEFYKLLFCLDSTKLSFENNKEIYENQDICDYFYPKHNISYYNNLVQTIVKDYEGVKEEIKKNFQQEINQICSSQTKLSTFIKRT